MFKEQHPYSINHGSPGDLQDLMVTMGVAERVGNRQVFEVVRPSRAVQLYSVQTRRCLQPVRGKVASNGRSVSLKGKLCKVVGITAGTRRCLGLIVSLPRGAVCP